MNRTWDELTENEKERMGELWKREGELHKMIDEIDAELSDLREEKRSIRSRQMVTTKKEKNQKKEA